MSLPKTFFPIMILSVSLTLVFIVGGAAQQLKLVVQTGHFSAVNSIAFSPDGKLLASGSQDNTIKLWSVETGLQIKSFGGGAEAINSIRFSPDGKFLASGGEDKTIRLWKVETGERIKFFNGHADAVRSIAFSPDGKFFVSGSSDATMKIWDREKSKLLATMFSPDKEDWVVMDEDGRFDASEQALKLMHYAYGLETIDLEQFKDEYFEPGLLDLLQKKANEQGHNYTIRQSD